jgi:acetylornithine/succinyldiaminopimelate/putrescine aminotransferase
VELARRLVALAPVDDAQVFFAISGSEAVEIALKTALGATGRPGILAFDPSYHGMTLGALAVTSRPEFRDPFAAHLHENVRRLPFGGDLESVDESLSGGEVGAVIVEPIVGREGVLIPPAGWLAGLAEICRRHGALLIADEIFTGFGRTGRLFAVDHEGVRPDILCCGKAMGGGLPIAAVLARRDLFRCWETSGEARHTATFIANPLACAAALAALAVIQESDLSARAARLGEDLGRQLAGWPQRFPAVEEVRGRGLLWGIQFRDAKAAKTWMLAAWSRGVLLLAGGPEGRVAQIVPPLTIREEQLTAAVGILEEELEILSAPSATPGASATS